MINVLVFPCGSEIGLEVHNALRFDKHIELFGLSSVSCHARMVYKNYLEGISFYTSETFIEELNKVIDDNKIDVLIPAYDDIIVYLSEIRDKLRCKLVTSGKEACDISRSKIKTYELFKGEFFTPRMYEAENIRENDLPLFAKPDIGQGSQGIMKVENMQDVQALKRVDEDYVISELLPGEEYTIDCFTDLKGKLLVASMRERRRIRMGISVNSATVVLPKEVRKIAEIINEKVEFNGVWFFQVKKDKNNNFKLLEMAPRVAGSMSTSRIKGFNYILNSVYQVMGYEVCAIPNLIEHVEVERAFSNKYIIDIDYNYVYVDFDDTITYQNTVNTVVISFLYQCLNEGKVLCLVTRHAKEIEESCKKYHIDMSMFSEIIHIKDEAKKSEYVSHLDAIFIDDSFRERYDVSSACKIPVFDVDGVEALLNWKY